MPDPTARYAERPASRTSVGQVFAFVAGFVALAAIGAVIGWTLTGSPEQPGHNNAAPLPSTSVSVAPSTPTVQPSTPTTPSSASGFVIPDYHGLGTMFTDARADLIAHKLSVALTFDAGDGTASTVVTTDPPAGTPVSKGTTVKMLVSGPAPTLQVRTTQGESCAQAGKELAGDGLLVSYPNQKSGLVAATDPPAGAPNVTWNSHIKVYCTPDGQMTPPAGGPSSPSDGSSSSPGASG